MRKRKWLAVAALEHAVLPPEVLHIRALVNIETVVQLAQIQSAVELREVDDIGLRIGGVSIQCDLHSLPHSPMPKL